MEVVGQITAITAVGLGHGIVQCWLPIVSHVVAINTIFHDGPIRIPFNAGAVVSQDTHVCAAVEFLYSGQGHDGPLTKRHDIDIGFAKIKSCTLRVGGHPLL